MPVSLTLPASSVHHIQFNNTGETGICANTESEKEIMPVSKLLSTSKY